MAVENLIRLALLGAGGRMGGLVLDAVSGRSNLDLVRIMGRAPHPDRARISAVGTAGVKRTLTVGPLTPEALEGVDVLIDFSSPSGLLEAARACRMTHTALVSGSTPLGADGSRVLDELALEVAVLHAPNFSRGLAALSGVLPQLRDRLGPRYEAGIIDVHHRHKVDAPSGTARMLDGIWSRSPAQPIPVASLRAGEVIGDHALWIDGGGERIEIWHRALDRRIFAEGALDAATWIAGCHPGRYGIDALWDSCSTSHLRVD